MTESYLLWNDHALQRFDFQMGRMRCVCITISISELRNSSKVRNSALEVDWSIWPVWRGIADGSPKVVFCVYCSQVGTSHLGTHKQRIPSEESP